VDEVVRMSRRNSLVFSLAALLVSAGLLYLTYRLIALGVATGDIRDRWSGSVLGLFVGYLGLYALAGAIGSMFIAVTGRELPEPASTGKARHAGTNGYSSADVDIDDGDWDD
jgi:hypothetical protein